jgi:hypothetical protein
MSSSLSGWSETDPTTSTQNLLLFARPLQYRHISRANNATIDRIVYFRFNFAWQRREQVSLLEDAFLQFGQNLLE